MLSLAANSASGADDFWEHMLGDNCQELWRGYEETAWPQGWVVENGVLTRAAGGGDLMTVATYADFVLQLEWKISSGGNSGIMYRVSTGDDAPYFSGPEYQILDNRKHPDSQKASTSAGSLYGLYAPERDSVQPVGQGVQPVGQWVQPVGQWVQPVGQWNTARIVVRGNHVEHWLNDRKTVDCEIGSADWNERVKNSKFAKWSKFGKNHEGHIVLQDHGDQVWYRKIRIHSFKSNP